MKQNPRRTAAFLLALLTAGSLFACGGRPEEANTDADGSPEQAPVSPTADPEPVETVPET